jgi:YHS domain-containing protein
MKLPLALLSSLLLGASLAFAATAAYPLKTCVVSGNELGSMGKPITQVYNGQEIKLCCKPCIKKFDANPAKYLSKLKK